MVLHSKALPFTDFYFLLSKMTVTTKTIIVLYFCSASEAQLVELKRGIAPIRRMCDHGADKIYQQSQHEFHTHRI